MGKKGGGRVRVKQVGPKGPPVNPLAELNSIAPEDQIFLPPRPDPNVTHIWPMSATFSLDYKKFSAIWPTYLDSKKSSKHGRRIAVADAVPEPSVQDISEALASMGVKHAIQPYKGYPGDVESRWYNPGRVLVDLEEAAEKMELGASEEGFDVDALPDMDGVLGAAGGNTKKALIRQISKKIPSLPGRAQRLEAKKVAKEEEEKREKERAAKAIAAKPGGGGGGSGGGTQSNKSSKKKGKKKR
mmetsp:Transcript_10789/g.23402  ORF Transcript_10789/g.23402 Transcript_10789/m.23402 type:complete len:243 (-) Transcript_10789:81-809(-)